MKSDRIENNKSPAVTNDLEKKEGNGRIYLRDLRDKSIQSKFDSDKFIADLNELVRYHINGGEINDHGYYQSFSNSFPNATTKIFCNADIITVKIANEGPSNNPVSNKAITNVKINAYTKDVSEIPEMQFSFNQDGLLVSASNISNKKDLEEPLDDFTLLENI